MCAFVLIVSNKNCTVKIGINFKTKLDQITTLLNDMNYSYMVLLEKEAFLLNVIKEEYPSL